jgi:hypothetical protein
MINLWFCVTNFFGLYTWWWQIKNDAETCSVIETRETYTTSIYFVCETVLTPNIKLYRYCIHDSTVRPERLPGNMIRQMCAFLPNTVNTVDKHVGRDSSVGIATRYRLDGPGIEIQWQSSKRRRSAVSSLLALRVRIPSREWMFVLWAVEKQVTWGRGI